jgi:2-oxo-4-hydroxy-4-carboxy-5-ureidoimidazoline decarboxylase
MPPRRRMNLGPMSADSLWLTLDAINRMQRAEFTHALGRIFEYSPWVAEATWPAQPFADVAALHRAIIAVVGSAAAEQQLELIRAHPDLAGKAARNGRMTAHSVSEQGGAGLLRLSETEYDRFLRLNTAYRERFGFPFIIAVRGHSKESLLAAFGARLGNHREAEIENALAEIFTIARLRLDALFGPG